ncbi:MAG: DNA mismatch repair endonuclease MutL [Muribaculaceae bacterium]|nr:DNA mismatch repair endonuclease MutL [Muribaculaceae bacterium]
MSDIIRLLPDSVANQIAAGEVIQRPASVIKELVENSIDAGATSVTIVLKDAGRTLIQVIDNGCGMSDTDARMAFERHATSKIRQADDLFTLHTMGFRGEALASIAAIAHVDLRTMQQGASVGTRLVINGSKVESQEPEACVPGSNMMVKDIFFNVPARRKFLKKDSVELSAIMREFERLALVNIGVDFTLVSNDVTVHSLRRGSMKQRICELFGKNLDKQLIPIETDTSIVSVTGFVGLPANARKRNALQYFMVNGRNMRHPYFHKAVMQCYEHLIPADEQPNYFISLRVDPETIDVNIHPTKNEIKFENEQGIWQILTAAIRDSLGRFNAAPAIDFDVQDAPEIPVFNPNAKASHDLEIDVAYNPFGQETVPPASEFFPPSMKTRSSAGSSHIASQPHRPAVPTDWEKLYDDFMRKRDEGLSTMVESKLNAASDAEPEKEPSLIDEMAQTDSTAFFTQQFGGAYILTPARGGLMVIDQYRAHLRVLYDSYMDKASEESLVAQATMFPEMLELSPQRHDVLSAISQRLRELGFVVTHRGGNTWSIDGVPSLLQDVSAKALVDELIDSVADTGLDAASTLHEKLALAMARSGAIRRGRQLSAAEMDRLVADLFKCSSPAITPDGKNVFAIIPVDYFSKILG